MIVQAWSQQKREDFKIINIFKQRILNKIKLQPKWQWFSKSVDFEQKLGEFYAGFSSLMLKWWASKIKDYLMWFYRGLSHDLKLISSKLKKHTRNNNKRRSSFFQNHNWEKSSKNDLEKDLSF